VAELTGDHLEFGKRAEPMLARWFTDRTGLHVAGEQTWCTHRDNGWARCTVDGFVFDGPNPDSIGAAIAVAEWKTTSDPPWVDVPAHYKAQAVWAMYVCDVEMVWFGVLHLAGGRPTFRTYEFARDESDERFAVERCTAFWHDFVLTGDPPPIDAHQATTDALKGQWAGSGGIVEADVVALALVEECRYHRAVVKAAKAEQEQADNRLRQLLGDDVELQSGGRKLATWKPSERTTVDTESLRKAWPDLVRDYERTTSTRTLLVPDPKGK
jgi:predicted phage-related endonuclease